MSDRSRQLALMFDEGGPETMAPAVRGGKGLSLAKFISLGMPVPYGFTIPTGACRAYLEHGDFPKRFDWHLDRCLSILQKKTGKKLGDSRWPLLVAVRSGGTESMPGMMDTILNVGCCTSARTGLTKIGGKVFADDCHTRFESAFFSATSQCTCDQCKSVFEAPQDPRMQIKEAIKAVFESWNSERAQEYRKAHGLTGWQGTAATVQEMVFGNMDDASCTGVVFSRDVRSGIHGLYGEFLVKAQGEAVVAGTTTPQPIKELAEWNPRIYQELNASVHKLEQDYDDIVDVEFTVERGKLFLLQCRRAKRSARATAVFAVQQVWNGALDRREAIKQLSDAQIDELKRNVFDPVAFDEAVKSRLFAKGKNASPGEIVGRAVFSSKRAIQMAKSGKVVLFRHETSPEDLSGMLAASAIVTAVGGETSHAAVVARSLNKAAVVGCDNLKISEHGRYAETGAGVIYEDDYVSVSGDTGNVVIGKIDLVVSDQHGEVANFLRWVDQFEGGGSRKGVIRPRLVFEHMEREVCVNRMLNDFYLSDAMARAARDSVLSQQAQALRINIHVDAAEFLACYLLVAVAGEIRHGCSRKETLSKNDKTRKAYVQLQKQYDALTEGRHERRREAQERAAQFLRDKPLSNPIEFLRLCATVFDDKVWEGTSIGGSLWAAIARAPLLFLEGEISHSVFVDHAFDLRHNGGRMFDKHPMVAHRTDDGDVHDQLEAKKHAESIEKLHAKLTRHHKNMSPEVEELWNMGLNIGLWGPRKVKHV